MNQFFAIVFVVLCSSTSLASTPLSIIGEPESFADDKAATLADLSYRVSVRPIIWAPVVMKVYISFNNPPSLEELQMSGRFVVKGLRDGRDDKIFSHETALSHVQLVELLQTIQREEVFNLGTAPLFVPPEQVMPKPFMELDASSWVFERVQSYRPSSPKYTIVSRVSCEHGPVERVFSAFSIHAAKLLDMKDGKPRKPNQGDAANRLR